MQDTLLSRVPSNGVWKLDVLFILALLQLADVGTTSIGVRMSGVSEINPVMVWCMAQFGSLWWLPKLALLAVMIVTLKHLRSHWPATVIAGLTLLMVLNNFAEIGTLSAARDLLGALMMRY